MMRMGSLTCFIVVSALLLSIVAKSAAFNFNFNFGGNSKIQSSVIQSTGMIPGETIAVVGASGNVGKLVALRLSETYNVHGIVREPSSVAPFFAGRDSKRIKLFQCDLLQEMKTSAASAEPQLACSDSLLEALESANGIVICTGTTAYPTKAWAKSDESSIAGDVLKALIDSKFSIKDAVSCLDELGLNTPNNVDARANEFILKVWDSVCSVQQKRAIMLSSIGVQRRDTMPFPILNIFGVLDAKAAGEESLKSSAAAGRYSWTIIRPGQLFGGPYDNMYDPKDLFQLENDTSTQQEIELGKGDELVGDTLRSTLAEITAQVCEGDFAHDIDFAVVNVKGDSPSLEAVRDRLRAL